MIQNPSSTDTPDPKKENFQPEVSTPLRRDDCNIQYGGTTTDTIPLTEPDKKDQNKCVRLYEILSTLTIEPVTFCFMFAYFMSMTCLSKLMMDKGCLYHLNYSSEVCNNLSGFPEEKDIVEKLATDYSLYFNCMNLLGAVCMIFIAPWSDKYGRKPPLLLSIFGSLLTDAGFIICTVYFDIRLEYLIIARIPAEIFGGFICVLTIIYSHASEVSTGRGRTLKYAFIEIAFGLGMGLGGLTSGFLYQYYSYFYIYITIAALHVFCFLWVAFVVEETTGLNVEIKWHKKAEDFFSSKSLQEGLKTTFRRREENRRALVLLLIASMCVMVLSYESLGTISYTYVHHIYDWDPTTYSIVNTTFILTLMTVTIMLAPFLIRRMKVTDNKLGVAGAFSMMAKNLITSFAPYSVYIYYIGNAAGFLSPLTILAVRTSISKLVEKEELGRVFSFLATCEATIPILGNVAVAKIFTATLNSVPSVTYLASSALLILPIGTFWWAIKSSKAPYQMLTTSGINPVGENP